MVPLYALQGCTETNNKVCQIFNEAGECNGTGKSFEPIAEKDITCEIYCF